jgi:two-component system, NarL family, response regulator NreC
MAPTVVFKPSCGVRWRTVVARIVVTDDNEVRREGLRRLLSGEPGWTVVGAGEVAALEEMLVRHGPDVVVLSTARGGDEVASAVRMATRLIPGCRVVIVSPQSSPTAVGEALRAGATGYILADDVLGGVIQAVRMANEPTPYLSSTLAAQLAMRNGMNGTPDLTERERQLLRLVALGYTNAEVAESMSLSVRTIEAQRARLQRKLHAPTRVGLVRAALAAGLIDRHDGIAPGPPGRPLTG